MSVTKFCAFVVFFASSRSERLKPKREALRSLAPECGAFAGVCCHRVASSCVASRVAQVHFKSAHKKGENKESGKASLIGPAAPP